MQEHERSERGADGDAGQEIDEDREQECREQDRGVGPRGAQQRREVRLVGHAPGDDDQHRRQRRKRDVSDQRHREQNEDQKIGRVKYTRDRPARAGADIGRGARDGAGGANAAKHDGCDIADALRDQFAIGAMPPPLMPSATTAERSDSIAPSNARAMASGKTARIFSRLKAGSEGDGNPDGIAPKRDPMVSTSRCNPAVIAAAAPTAISNAGHVGRKRRTARMIATDNSETATATGLIVGSALHKCLQLRHEFRRLFRNMRGRENRASASRR